MAADAVQPNSLYKTAPGKAHTPPVLRFRHIFLGVGRACVHFITRGCDESIDGASATRVAC